jgi:hypothetical protein
MKPPALSLSGWIWPRALLLLTCDSTSQRDEQAVKRGLHIVSWSREHLSDRGEDQVRILRRGQSNEVWLPRGSAVSSPFTAADDEAALSESLAHRISCPGLPSHRLVSRQLGHTGWKVVGAWHPGREKHQKGQDVIVPAS